MRANRAAVGRGAWVVLGILIATLVVVVLAVVFGGGGSGGGGGIGY
jgi:hypothetical protein